MWFFTPQPFFCPPGMPVRHGHLNNGKIWRCCGACAMDIRRPSKKQGTWRSRTSWFTEHDTHPNLTPKIDRINWADLWTNLYHPTRHSRQILSALRHLGLMAVPLDTALGTDTMLRQGVAAWKLTNDLPSDGVFNNYGLLGKLGCPNSFSKRPISLPMHTWYIYIHTHASCLDRKVKPWCQTP